MKKAFAERSAAIRQATEEARERRLARRSAWQRSIQARLAAIEAEVARSTSAPSAEGERQKRELIAAAEAESQKILQAARTEVDNRLKNARARADRIRRAARRRAGRSASARDDHRRGQDQPLSGEPPRRPRGAVMIRRFARPYARAIMDVAGSPAKANELRGELMHFANARSRIRRAAGALRQARRSTRPRSSPSRAASPSG